jgi:hypothetical protein
MELADHVADDLVAVALEMRIISVATVPPCSELPVAWSRAGQVDARSIASIDLRFDAHSDFMIDGPPTLPVP